MFRLLSLMAFSLCTLLFTGVVAAQQIKLNSYPNAAPTIFIDFDGHYVKGTSWNWSGPINALPSGFNNIAIAEIFDRVAEDFRPFNINITTDSTVYFKAPIKKRTRIIVTPTSQWYGNAGGAAWVGSFIWGDETPAFVFCNLLGYSTKKVAEAVSHEAGHTLGLQHQSTYDENCKLIREYNFGKGSGETSWAPIMGEGYSRNLTTWTVGQTIIGCNHIQDDIKVITSNANGITFRTDDVGDNLPNATNIPLGGGSIETNAILSRHDDRDVFSITFIAGGSFKIEVSPYSVATDHAGANVDIKLTLMNGAGDTLNTYNPPNRVSASIDTFLNPGTYFFAIDGVGNNYLSDTSSIGLYNITGLYLASGALAIHDVKLNGTKKNGNHQFSWEIKADETIEEAELQYSPDRKNFTTLFVAGDKNGFNYKPLTAGNAYYRLKVKGKISKQEKYSNIVTLGAESSLPPIRIANKGNGTYGIESNGNYTYTLVDQTGRLIRKGLLKPGNNFIELTSRGMSFLHVNDGNVQFTGKLIKQ